MLRGLDGVAFLTRRHGVLDVLVHAPQTYSCLTRQRVACMPGWDMS